MAKVGIYKTDLESGKYLAGAVFNLYTADDIYDADGSLVFAAGELVATSPETNADGTTYFDCDIPIRGEQYGSSTHKDAATNSGKYIIEEIRAPLGYYVNEEPMEVTFTYDGQTVRILESTCTDKPTEMWVSKRDLTNDEELPGATLTIQDMDDNIVESQKEERPRCRAGRPKAGVAGGFAGRHASDRLPAGARQAGQRDHLRQCRTGVESLPAGDCRDVL